MASLARYVVALEAQSKAYVTELEKANRKLDQFHQRQTKSIDFIKKGFLALGGVLSARMFATFIGQSLKAADETAKLARRLDTTTEFLTQMQHAAQLSGVEFTTFTKSLEGMTRRAGEAAIGLGESRIAFLQLGIDAKKFSALNAEQQFVALTKALSAVRNASQRAALASKLFGEQGAALLNIIDQGPEALAAMRAESDRLGKTLKTSTAEAAERANDSMTRMKASMQSLTNQVLPSLAKALEVVATGWNSILFGNKSPVPFENQILALEDKLRQLETRGFARTAAIQAGTLQEQIAKVNAEIDAYRVKQRQAEGLDPSPLVAMATAYEAIAISAGNAAESAVKYFERAGPRTPDALAKTFALESQRRRDEAEAMRQQFSEQTQESLKGIHATLAENDQLLVEAAKKTETLGREFSNMSMAVAGTLTDTLAGAFLGIETNWREMLKRMVAEFLARQAIFGLATAIGGPVGAFLTAGFGGGRASGGPVSAGTAYLVGERGPELFMPNVSGMVSPGGGGIVINMPVTIDARGAVGAEVLATLPAVIERRTIASIQELRRRGRF